MNQKEVSKTPMSKKQRQKQLQQPTRRAARPAAPVAYPTPAECERSIKRREQLLAKLIRAAILHPGDMSGVDQLVRQYGIQEVILVTNVLQGHLRAPEAAGRLLALLGRENDWLSDRLPAAWTMIGPAAEPPLWEYLTAGSRDPEARGVVYLGLARLAEAHPARRADVVAGLTRLLEHAPAADATANAYLVHVLDRLAAVEAAPAIAAAFQQGRVDPEIIQPYDVEFLPA